MKSDSASSQRFNLKASTLASYFKFRCDRHFRWESVDAPARSKAGIGWGVPKRIRNRNRPGIAALLVAGNLFEANEVEALVDDHGEAAVLAEPFELSDDQRIVPPLPFERFAQAFASEPFPKFVAQLELTIGPVEERTFLERYGLDPGRVRLASARPDLLEVLAPAVEGGPHRLRIWDFKSSESAKHEHFIQVAYYSLLLDHLLREKGMDSVEVDLESAVVKCRAEELVLFELEPYRLAVEDFLRVKSKALFDTPSAEAHFHVEDKCTLCEYRDTCRAECDAGRDLSRIAYLTSESKRRLYQLGYRSAPDLAALSDPERIRALRAASHDLSVHLARYVATAQTLQNGLPQALDATTLQMPSYEGVRIILSAEQDAVTGICFAIGMKTFEGKDEATGETLGGEHVFVAESPDGEGAMLLEFLQTLNALLTRVDAENRAIDALPRDAHPQVVAAQEGLRRAEADYAVFKERHGRLSRKRPDYHALDAERTRLQREVGVAEKALKEAVRAASKEIGKARRSLHFYIYDSLDLSALKRCVERHLSDAHTPGLTTELAHLVRLFPPESVLKDAETFRSIPGTVVTDVLRRLVALPAPYLFDLRTVSELFRPTDREGEEKGFAFRPAYGFGWEFSNQVAFERIHDVWSGKEFVPDPRDQERRLTPAEVLEKIVATVKAKLAATDSIVWRLKQDYKERLRLWKEPFRLYGGLDPVNLPLLETLRIFTLLEASFGELGVKHLHTLPAEDRAAKFECIRGLRYESRHEEGGSLWFTFDPECRDSKFDVGDFNLVLTEEDRPDALVATIDGHLFERNSLWRADGNKVELVEYDFAGDPPRVRLRPYKPEVFAETVDLSKPCVLDRLYADYTSARALKVLSRLQEAPESALHVHRLLDGTRDPGWRPVVSDRAATEAALRECASRAGVDAGRLLNAGQWGAWHGVFREPLSLVWGPPGTGKTYTVAHILLGYILSAAATGRRTRILVTASTHHAIANVMGKLSELAARYEIPEETYRLHQLRGSGNPAHASLPASVTLEENERLVALLQTEAPCVVVGSTVWSLFRGMEKAGGPVQPWFDVVLVDEASQMKLPDALIAFAASGPDSNVILAGDDRQLPPIIHGEYPKDRKNILTSVFAFVRSQVEERAEVDPGVEDRMLFQLEENFRMNEPLTAYPRHALYRGRYSSSFPKITIALDPPADPAGDDLADILLDPSKPAVLCWYRPPRSFTARNPFEADLVARLAEALRRRLVDPKTGSVYSPDGLARSGLAILAPHRAQNSAIRQALGALGFGADGQPMPLVDTVEKLQGKERDVVLVSYGVADQEYAEAEAGFLLSQARFNVATTRAARKLIVLCSDVVLDAVPADRTVLLESMTIKKYRHYCSDGHLSLEVPTADHDTVALQVQWKGF